MIKHLESTLSWSRSLAASLCHCSAAEGATLQSGRKIDTSARDSKVGPVRAARSQLCGSLMFLTVLTQVCLSLHEWRLTSFNRIRSAVRLSIGSR